MMKKLMNKKRNNKGFSLVELIVVVLIIAIIAVALAPQVMKWVGTSRTNTNANNEATLESAIQVAVAEAQSHGWTVTIPAPGEDITVGNFPYIDDALVADIDGCIGNVLGNEYPIPQGGTAFVVTITSTGAVTITQR
jgi:prepilin-type N-terminal cleavage/methylation domain-containing protein